MGKPSQSTYFYGVKLKVHVLILNANMERLSVEGTVDHSKQKRNPTIFHVNLDCV